MPDKAFLDTNILIYAFSVNDPRRPVALDLLLAGGAIGVQTLNEFVNVIRGKMNTPWPEALIWLETVQELCLPAIAVTLRVHQDGVRIAYEFGYHIYDALMLAAALEAECTVFYSEDMKDGQVVGDLTIRNPFGPGKRKSHLPEPAFQ